MGITGLNSINLEHLLRIGKQAVPETRGIKVGVSDAVIWLSNPPIHHDLQGAALKQGYQVKMAAAAPAARDQPEQTMDANEVPLTWDLPGRNIYAFRQGEGDWK